MDKDFSEVKKWWNKLHYKMKLKAVRGLYGYDDINADEIEKNISDKEILEIFEMRTLLNIKTN